MPMVDAGRNIIAAMIVASGPPTAFNNANAYIGVGTSATAYNASQTDLLGTSYRQAMEATYPTIATNVLTFDYTQAPVVTADLVLCAPVVAREAQENGKTLQAHYAHLLVHGTLHAQGWDHETSDEDAQEMEAYEIDILDELGIDNPYC